jgi:hypothetical protein
MTEKLTRKLLTCIAIEATTLEIYRALALMFRGARDFWAELEESEKKHVKVLLAAGGYHLSGKMPEYLVPSSLGEIDETYRLVNEAKNRVDSGTLSLRDALELALRIENAIGERYLQEVMRGEDNSVVIAGLQRLYGEEKLHSEMICDFIKKRGMG